MRRLGCEYHVCDGGECISWRMPDAELVAAGLLDAYESGLCSKVIDAAGNLLGESCVPCSLHGGTLCPLYGGGTSTLC